MAAIEFKLRKYIRQILKESLVLESARGAALGAVMARALADQIIADLPRVGLLYYSEHGAYGKRMSHYIPGSDTIEIIGIGTLSSSDTASRLWYDANDSSDSHIFKIASAGSFSEYGGNCLILGTGFFHDNPSLKNSWGNNLTTNQAEYERYGNQFLESRISNQDTRDQLLKSFGSAAAIGYFVAMFIVFHPEKASGSSLGHVHATTVNDLNAQPILRFVDNIMTVSAGNVSSGLLQLLKDRFSETLRKNSTKDMKYKLPGGSISAQAVGQGIHNMIQRNGTYIHELQHLLQAAVYDVPAAAANPISADSGDVSNPNHPLHPYFGQIVHAEAHGIIKAQRPKESYVNIMSDLLLGAGLITSKTSENIAGLSAPAFTYNPAGGIIEFRIKNTADHNQPKLIAIIAKETRRPPAATKAIEYLKNTYLTSIPSAANDPEERAAQLARFGDAKGKKAVARKYRRFVADIFAQSGFEAKSEQLYSYRTQKRDNPAAQRNVERGAGPMSITYTDALSALTDTQKKKIESLNSNKGNLTGKEIDFVAQNAPLVIIFSKALNISLSPSVRDGVYMYPDWLEKSGLDRGLVSDINNFADSLQGRDLNSWMGMPLPDNLRERLIEALDLKLVVGVPKAQGNRAEANRQPALVASTGRLQSPAKGIGNMGAAWYKRADGYVWSKLKNEYNAEFVQTVAGFLYSLYMLNDPQNDTLNIDLDIVDDYLDTRAKREQLLFTLLNEDIDGLKVIIEKLIRKSAHASGFKRNADQDFVEQQQDQIRRLAIQLIETMQGITDEELKDIQETVFSDYNRDKLKSNTVTAAQSSKYEKIIQDFINSNGIDKSAPVQVAHSDLILDFSLKLLGWLGNKFIG